MVYAALAVFPVKVQEDFGIGLGAKTVTARRLQLRSQYPVIVNFSVKDQMVLSVFRGHRLMASGQIDNGESLKTETCSRKRLVTLIVWAAMTHGSGHGMEQRQSRNLVIGRRDSADAAQLMFPLHRCIELFISLGDFFHGIRTFNPCARLRALGSEISSNFLQFQKLFKGCRFSLFGRDNP